MTPAQTARPAAPTPTATGNGDLAGELVELCLKARVLRLQPDASALGAASPFQAIRQFTVGMRRPQVSEAADSGRLKRSRTATRVSAAARPARQS